MEILHLAAPCLNVPVTFTLDVTMQRALWLKLVLPLILATAATLMIHVRWPADGFFMNLAAGFIGILVTVVYVDWILRRHEHERWKGTQERIATRLQYLASSAVTDVRVCLGIGTDVFDNGVMWAGNPSAMRGEMRRVALDVIVPATRARIGALDPAGWAKLCAALEAKSLECGKLLDRFGARLRPDLLELILDLQQHLDSAQTFWRIFPDIAGVPVSQLPRTTTPPEQLQAEWNDLTTKELSQAVGDAAKLLEALSRGV